MKRINKAEKEVYTVKIDKEDPVATVDHELAQSRNFKEEKKSLNSVLPEKNSCNATDRIRRKSGDVFRELGLQNVRMANKVLKCLLDAVLENSRALFCETSAEMGMVTE